MTGAYRSILMPDLELRVQASASLFYNFGMWLGQRRWNVRQPRLSAHKAGAVFVNTPDT